MTTARDVLSRQLETEQEHVLATVSGLGAEALLRAPAPSGWTFAGLLSHLTYDVEIFWVHAVLAGTDDGIAAVTDGWGATPSDPLLAVDRYAAAARRSRELLAAADLDAAPRWWPPAEVFPFPPFATGWECLARTLSETATHAGHLDLCRELVDGRQHLVVR